MSPVVGWYAGIGSRKTPPELLERMGAIATELARRGWGLRSGGAPGADTAFEAGALAAGGACTSFWPWRAFGQSPAGVIASTLPGWDATEAIAAHHHPAYASLARSVQSLMRRNVMQVLGPDVASPSRFVVMWAPRPRQDAAGRICDCGGGTGQAVRIAYERGIPVFHLEVHAARFAPLLAAA